MEMNVPLPEELEWLETHSLLPEDEEEEYLVEEDEELQHLGPAIPDDTPVSKNQKRLRAEEDGEALEDSVEPLSAEKRRKGSTFGAGDTSLGNDPVPDEAAEPEADEDWLRYSSTKDPVVDAVLGSGPVADPPVESAVVEEKIVSRFASEIDGDCISVTGPCGDRVYAKIHSGRADASVKNLRMERPGKDLLLEPINVLMERVEEEAMAKALKESFASPSDPAHSTTSMVSEQLWVDKYAPNSFMELLSDEQTNREVLLWLKQWDSCVFGSQIRATTDDVLTSLRRHSSIAQQPKFFGSTNFSKNRGAPFSSHEFKQSNILEKEDYNLQGTSESWSKNSVTTSPPEQKILLLCGPPGLGKTTLAHVAAKHCGYRIVEINASDERSSSAVESKILDVVQMNSVMADAKPKCLVIDEIDGALGEGKGAIEVILKMVTAEKKSSNENNHLEAPSGKASSKKGRKTTKLARPVICICNDLYAPALRSLRQIAKVHIFVQPTISRVVNRIKYICKMERFNTSSIALSALAEYTECDIRSCLNTLQFLYKKKETLNVLEVDSQVVGRKDMSKSAFDVWREVFQKRKSKREKKSKNISAAVGDFEFVYSLVSNRGEYELTMDGIFENFLQLGYHDPLMHKTAGCLDLLGISDSLLRYTMRTQQMSLNAYQPFIAICVKNLIAQFDKPNIEWPKSFQRWRAMLMEKKDMLKLWRSKLSPSISRHLSTESFVENVVSPLLHILSPPTLRPVALHLLSEKERDDLSQLVDTMVAYSLTYKNLKVEPTPKTKYGNTSNAQLLSLEPPIDNFVNFKDYQPEYHGLSSATKLVLVHEVEKCRILCESSGRSVDRNDGNHNLNHAPSPGAAKTSPKAPNSGNASIGKYTLQNENISAQHSNRNSPVSGMKLKAPGGPKKSSRHSTSFFDRFRKQGGKDPETPDSVLPNTATMERDLRPLLFKYNEGFTNAVKRPVRMRELLL